MHPLITLIASALALMLAGCAGDASKKGTPRASRDNPLAIIQIEKGPPASAGDCPVSVKISNRMQGTAWDGASYHLALLDNKNVAIGRLMGAPHHYTKPGSDLVDAGLALGAKCEDVAAVSLIYFGYYPAGKKQVPLHIDRVKAEMK